MALNIRRPLLRDITARGFESVVVTTLSNVIHHAGRRLLIVSVAVASRQYQR
jgi:hypothetical protein